jgi:hypothetical protein
VLVEGLVGLSFFEFFVWRDSLRVCCFRLLPPLSLCCSPVNWLSGCNFCSGGWIVSIFGGGCSPGSGGSTDRSTLVQCAVDLIVVDSGDSAVMVGDFTITKHVRARECICVNHVWLYWFNCKLM